MRGDSLCHRRDGRNADMRFRHTSRIADRGSELGKEAVRACGVAVCVELRTPTLEPPIVSFTLTQLLVKLGAGQSPVSLDGTNTDVQYFGDLRNRQSGKESKLNHFSLPGRLLL